MNELAQRLLEIIELAKATEGDQRSALGMARTWVENRKPIQRQTYFVEQFKRRDDLAEALVSAMSFEEPVDCIAALGSVRRHLNAPFIDLSMNGQQGRAANLKPRDAENANGGNRA